MTETENELLEDNQQQPNVQIVPCDYQRQVSSTKSSNGKLNVAVSKPTTEIKEPPDGGARAWCIMVSAFLCNGVIFGIINCYSVINSYLQDKLNAQGVENASSKAGEFIVLTNLFWSIEFDAVSSWLTASRLSLALWKCEKPLKIKPIYFFICLSVFFAYWMKSSLMQLLQNCWWIVKFFFHVIDFYQLARVYWGFVYSSREVFSQLAVSIGTKGGFDYYFSFSCWSVLAWIWGIV